ncbi:MAG: hypothetical protein JWO03_2989 [Bacteroidetes bacterium]|nr:hypothetical protein [Bacteroidota bacterium]
MAIDTTPSTVATNALQAIPFASLIGGPLDACIQAQAQAAKTSYEFINQVGLTVDPITGEKKAINVTFQYNNQGQLATLVVPLIVIVPIPYMSIDLVEIDFLANISASSSSVSETSSDSELGVDVEAEAALNIGPFSLKVKASANYSSKQHSKASQDSKYSVEYTMGVKVRGGATDMPAGMAAILNILQGSITSTNPNDLMMISPKSLDIDRQKSGTLQVTVKNSQGLVVPGVEVVLSVILDPNTPSPFSDISAVVGKSPALIRANIREGNNFTIVHKSYARYYGSSNIQLKAHHKEKLMAVGGSTRNAALAAGTTTPPVTAVTDKNGIVIFKMTLTESVFQGNTNLSGKLKLVTDIPQPGSDGNFKLQPEEQEVPYFIIPFGPTLQLSADKNAVAFVGTAGEQQTITLSAMQDMGTAVPNMEIITTVTLDSGSVATVFNAISSAPAASGTPTAITATASTDANGQIIFTYTLNAAVTTAMTGMINFTCDEVSVDIPLTIK